MDVDPLFVQILEICKNGATKSKIVNDLAISHVALRKALAELVDKRFLQYIEPIFYNSQRVALSEKNTAIVTKIIQSVVLGIDRRLSIQGQNACYVCFHLQRLFKH